MAASAAANAAAPRKKRVQGPWMCQVEQLAVLRSGIAVSISSGESTMEKLEKNMGDQWPQQLERATQEHGWSEKNLKKKFGSEPWTIATAKSARVELKRLWPQLPGVEGLVSQRGQPAVPQVPQCRSVSAFWDNQGGCDALHAAHLLAA